MRGSQGKDGGKRVLESQAGDRELQAGSTALRNSNEKVGKKKKLRSSGGDDTELDVMQQQHEKRKVKGTEEASNARLYTISMAVPGSVVDNAQSFELATALAGQIARAAAIFRVDEIIVYDDPQESSERAVDIRSTRRRWREKATESGGVFLARILQYLEIPQYLRRALVPFHSGLKFAGLLPPLDAPHHARLNEWPLYREGVVEERRRANDEASHGSWVDVGLQKGVRIRQTVAPGLRVTVAMGPHRNISSSEELEAVSPNEPREKEGLYWGYSVRLASAISGIFTDSPFKGGYDVLIGTSEHGRRVCASDYTVPNFNHLLLVFGGVHGIEESVSLDPVLKGKPSASLFDDYINTCPDQGSRTIRMEEAILISLAYLQDPLRRSTEKA